MTGDEGFANRDFFARRFPVASGAPRDEMGQIAIAGPKKPDAGKHFVEQVTTCASKRGANLVIVAVWGLANDHDGRTHRPRTENGVAGVGFECTAVKTTYGLMKGVNAGAGAGKSLGLR